MMTVHRHVNEEWRKGCVYRIRIYCDDPRHPNGRPVTVAEFGVERSHWSLSPKYAHHVTLLDENNKPLRSLESPADFRKTHNQIRWECAICAKRPGARDRPVARMRSDRLEELLWHVAQDTGYGHVDISFREFLARLGSMERAGESSDPPAV